MAMYARHELAGPANGSLDLFENSQLEHSYVGGLLYSPLLSVVWTQ